MSARQVPGSGHGPAPAPAPAPAPGPGPGPGPASGRAAQRRRTREAILAATKALLADGHTPSIDEVASAADVSRRTIYMYFPTLDQLLVDATSGLLSQRSIEPLLDSPGFTAEADPRVRVDEFAAAMLRLAPDALPLARRMFRLTVEAERPPGAARRGYRRVEWIEQVLEPLRARLTAEQFERLRAGLAVVLGWEAMIVLRDTLGLGPADEERVLRWAAGALVSAVLAEDAPA